MNELTLHWFAAGAVLIGAFVSIFTPANTLCPLDLSASARVYIAMTLGAAQACFQAISTGTPWMTAIGTALASVVAVVLAHGSSAGDPKKEV